MTVRRARGILPGFGLSLGTSVLYLTLLVLVPLAGVALRGATARWEDIWHASTSARALASFRLSFFASVAAGAGNAVAGLLIAWVLVRYRFAGRSVLDALVDVPFALPTAVAGLALTAVYSADGWLGRWLAPLGIEVAYTPIGVWLAMTFVGLPFVVRTVQPVLAGIDAHLEEAAAVLGAGRLQAFGRVIFPTVLPAVDRVHLGQPAAAHRDRATPHRRPARAVRLRRRHRAGARLAPRLVRAPVRNQRAPALERPAPGAFSWVNGCRSASRS